MRNTIPISCWPHGAMRRATRPVAFKILNSSKYIPICSNLSLVTRTTKIINIILISAACQVCLISDSTDMFKWICRSTVRVFLIIKMIPNQVSWYLTTFLFFYGSKLHLMCKWQIGPRCQNNIRFLLVNAFPKKQMENILPTPSVFFMKSLNGIRITHLNFVFTHHA